MKNSVKIIIVVALCVVVGIGILIGIGASNQGNTYSDTISYEYTVTFEDSIPTTSGTQEAQPGVWRYAVYKVTVYDDLGDATLDAKNWLVKQDGYKTTGAVEFTYSYTGDNPYRLTKMVKGEKYTVTLIFMALEENCSDDRLVLTNLAGYELRK